MPTTDDNLRGILATHVADVGVGPLLDALTDAGYLVIHRDTSHLSEDAQRRLRRAFARLRWGANLPINRGSYDPTLVHAEIVIESLEQLVGVLVDAGDRFDALEREHHGILHDLAAVGRVLDRVRPSASTDADVS